MKRTIISLGIIAVVAAVAIGATIAYFNDTETSTGNIFTAGTIDLKVDHLMASYNGQECHGNCDVTIVSNTQDAANSAFAVATWVHPSWTSISGATWIWDTSYVQNPTQDETVVFTKSFSVGGVISSASLDIAADNGYKVYVNGNLIDDKLAIENNFSSPTNYNVTSAMVAGTNTIQVTVKNFALENSTPETNPAGLLYRLQIMSNCGGDYALWNGSCELWSAKDLTNEKFFNFGDIKPGDWGTNLISLHVDSNDAWACLFADKTGTNEEAISNDLNVVIWADDGNGSHEAGEPILFNGKLIDTAIPVAESGGAPITGGTTKYVGLAWCFGPQTADTNTAAIGCSGASVGDAAQGDTLTATLTAYAEQARNNAGFKCAGVNLPTTHPAE